LSASRLREAKKLIHLLIACAAHIKYVSEEIKNNEHAGRTEKAKGLEMEVSSVQNAIPV